MNDINEALASLVQAVANHPQRCLAFAAAVTFIIALVLDWMPKRAPEKSKRTPPPPIRRLF
jgi:hypothetical protein